MKKTLITLLAMASCAMGATVTQEQSTAYLNAGTAGTAVSDWTQAWYNTPITLTENDNGSVTLTGDFAQNVGIRSVFAMAITLDGSKLTLPSASAEGAITSTALVTYDGSKADTGLGLTSAGKVTGTWVDSTTTNYAYLTAGNALATDKLTTVVLTFTNAGTCIYLAPEGNYANGTFWSNQNLRGDIGTVSGITLSAAAVAAMVNMTTWSGADVDVQRGDNAFASAAVGITNGFVIPEPATATLSLLALAGLAARRRRK